MKFDTGRFLIKNADSGNLAVLLDANQGTDLAGAIPGLDDSLKGEKAVQWNIVLLSTKKFNKYKIQNFDFAGYASCDTRPEPGHSVRGKTGARQWAIKETKRSGHYTISTGNDPELFWGLPDDEDGTPLELFVNGSDPHNQWTFERVSDLDDCIRDILGDSRSRCLKALDDFPSLAVTQLDAAIQDGGLAAVITLLSHSDSIIQSTASSTLTSLAFIALPHIIVDLSGRRPVLSQVRALQKVVDLAVVDQIKVVAVELYMIPHLVKLLNSDEDTIVCKAAEALTVLMSLPGARTVAYEAQAGPAAERCGMVPRLVGLLAAEDVTVQTKALEALLAITTYEPAAGKAGAKEALEKIIEANGNGNVKTLATAVLKNLSEYTCPPIEVLLPTTEARPEEEEKPEPEPDDEIRVRSMKTLVGQIEGKDVSLWADAAFTLWKATAETIEAEAAIDVGVVAPLVKVLGSPETVTLRNAVGALRNLALRPRAQVILLELKVIPTFIKLLDHPDFQTRTNATGFIQHIAGNGVDAENACLDGGVIPLLIKLLKSNDTTDLQNAGGALWALTVHLVGQIKCYDEGAVPALARLLGNETALVRRNAVGSLQNITLRPPAQEALMNQHCLSALFKLFTDETDLTRQNASATIRNLTLHEPARAKVSDAGGLPVFIKMLYSDNATERNNAAGAIRNTTLYTGAQTVAVRAGIVAAFKSVLALSDTTAYSNAVAAIRTISVDQSAKEALLEGGMIPILVRILKDEDDMTTVEHAAGALQNIALHAPAQVVCLTSDSVPALAKQISTSTNTNVLLNSLGGLRNITLHEPARQVVLDAGSIPVLARLLDNEDQGIRTAAAGLMQNVTINAQAKEAALRAGAIPPLVKLIKSQDTTERTNAIGALWGISVHGPAQEVATDAGALSLLIPLLGSSYDITTRNYASGAIQNISLYSRAKLICVELGALPLLRDVVANSDTTARTNAAIAMWSIAVYGDVAQKAILETGVIESLVAMMRECSGNATGEANAQNKAVGALRSTFGHVPCREEAKSLGALPLLRQILAGNNTEAHEAARGAISDIEY